MDQRFLSEQDTPSWLKDLENRLKRPYRLAHEIGAGAPCLVCKEKCKGLNLHFWRKLCIECKCRKEHHDFVDEDEYSQFEILFGTKRVKKTIFKHDSINKTFDWIPQDAPQELVVGYLNALPTSKLPISNTEGANYRKRQLEMQLPLHDVNPYACHSLTQEELIEFYKYLDNLKSNVVGQGKIIMCEQKIDVCKGWDLVSATDTNSSKAYCAEVHSHLTTEKSEKGNISYSEKVKLDPAAYAHHSIEGSTNRVVSENDRNSDGSKNQLSSSESSHISSVRASSTDFPFVYGKIKGLGIEEQYPRIDRSPKFGSTARGITPNSVPSDSDVCNNNMIDEVLANLPNLKDSEKSDCYNNNNNSNNNNNNNNNNSHRVTACTEIDILHRGSYLYDPAVPSNLNVEPSSAAGRGQDVVTFNELCRPATDSIVLPIGHDAITASSSKLPFVPVSETKIIPGRTGTAMDVKKLKDQSSIPYSEKAPTIIDLPGLICMQCRETLQRSDIVVTADRAPKTCLWHANCFVCHDCNELLVDLMYFYHKGKVYCGRDYAKAIKIPRCFACDELIFVKEYTCAEGESYHVKHFCCFHCDEPLGGKQYVPKDNLPVCLPCYQIHYGKTCSACEKVIQATEQRISWGDFNFHAAAQCFCCSNCRTSLVGGKFVVKYEKLFCGRECVQKQMQSLNK